jgi:ABC-type sugar transport system substrate-binding protein
MNTRYLSIAIASVLIFAGCTGKKTEEGKQKTPTVDGAIVVVAELDGGGLRDEGYRAAADALQAHPNLAGIFAINDPSALGAWKAVDEAGKTDKIKIVGFDGEHAGKIAIKEGKIFADPIQFPRQMGIDTVQNIVKYIEGEKFEQIHLIPTKLYKKEDALKEFPDGEDAKEDDDKTTDENESPFDQPKVGTIAFSALTLKNPFFKIIADSLTEEAKKNGYDVIVNDAERDVNEQSKHIDNYIQQKVTAIVLNPADRIAIGAAVKKANAAGIPVFTCDLQCTAEDAKIAGHVGTDNYSGGKLAGEAMIEALGEAGGEVLILHFNQANSCVLRVKGFREVIDAHNKQLADKKGDK